MPWERTIRRTAARLRRGFSLVELVVVVLVLGIIAAIAVPRLFATSRTAVDNGLRQTLSVIRDAIDKYSAEHGALPGADGSQATFKADLGPYLRGGVFPTCPVGAGNDAVRMQAGTGPVATNITATKTIYSWAFKYESGYFHVNSDDVSADGVTTYEKF